VHIPPGRNDVNDWYAQTYANLSARYADVIAAHMGGHIHSDAYEVFSDSSARPLGVFYIAPSVTTFTNHNPSFRVYEYDAAAGEARAWVGLFGLGAF
jgi:sphingomyelin phosphodiesterase